MMTASLYTSATKNQKVSFANLLQSSKREKPCLHFFLPKSNKPGICALQKLQFSNRCKSKLIKVMTTGRAGGLHCPPLGHFISRAYRLIELISLASFALPPKIWQFWLFPPQGEAVSLHLAFANSFYRYAAKSHFLGRCSSPPKASAFRGPHNYARLMRCCRVRCPHRTSLNITGKCRHPPLQFTPHPSFAPQNPPSR